MMIYKFREGSRLSGDAQAVGKELETVQLHSKGLTAHTVLAWARSSHSVLHRYIEWDDAKAAEAHRIEQAGHLIRSVVVLIEPEPSSPQQVELSTVAPAPAKPAATVRAFVPVHTAAGDRVYLSTSEALADTEYRRQVLKQAHHDLDAVARKYRELQELAQVVRAIDHVGVLLQESRADA